MATLVLLIIITICAVSLPILTTGQCTPDPCRNGGICVLGYKGKGYRCKCPSSGSLIYGYNCEIANIGFHAAAEGNDIRSAIKPTNSFIGSTNQMFLSFEFIGRCYNESDTRCHILSLTSPDAKPLFTVWMYKSDSNQTKYIWIVDLLERWIVELRHPTANFTLGPLTGSIDTDKWIRMTFLATRRPQTIRADIVSLYPREGEKLIERTILLPDLEIEALSVSIENSTLVLGGFYGCVRFVNINGELVDLGSFTLHRNSVPINESDYNKYASHFCYPTEKSCHSSTSQLGQRIFDSNSRTKCGANSKCDGVLDSDMGCSCRCDIGKRRQLDALINMDSCRQKWKKQDECVDDTTIISTGQSDFQLKWEASDSKCLNISAHAFSIEFIVLTNQVNVTSMLELKGVLSIEIVNGYLKLCLPKAEKSKVKRNRNRKCYDFPSVEVSDDVWHEISVVKHVSQLFLKIDSLTDMTNISDFEDLICQCQIMLPNSCIRGLRISDVAMPVRETDKVIDYSGKPIAFHMGSNVSVNDHCNFDETGLTPPTSNPTTTTTITTTKTTSTTTKTPLTTTTITTTITTTTTTTTTITATETPSASNRHRTKSKRSSKAMSISYKQPIDGSVQNSKPDIKIRQDSSEKDTNMSNILRANWMVMITAVLTLVAFSVCELPV